MWSWLAATSRGPGGTSTWWTGVVPCHAGVMDLGLDGKLALVTGGYRGTGAGIAAVLAAEGARVLVHGFEPGQADEVVAAIRDDGGVADPVVGDLLSEDAADDIARQVGGHGPLGVLVNNYGVAEGGSWAHSDTDAWIESYEKNVLSGVRLVRRFIPQMREAGWGRIIFVSTIGATRPGTANPQYYAAKGALPTMTVSLAKELADTGITVNTVSPGMIATDEIVEMYTRRAERDGHPTDRAAVEQQMLAGFLPNPSGRVPTPVDIGGVVAFVASVPAWHVNGTHLRVDGGAADAVT